MHETTFHGLEEIATSTKARDKAFHVILVTVSYCLTIYGFYHIFGGYINKPVISSIMLQENDSLSLPQITICPFSRLDQDALTEHNISEELAAFMEFGFFATNPNYGLVSMNDSVLALHFMGIRNFTAELDVLYERTGVENYEELLNTLSFKCEDIFQSCYIGAEFLLVDCCQVLEREYLDMGRCFRFPSYQQELAGLGNGIEIAAKLPTNKFTFSETMLLNDGILVRLTEKNIGPGFDAIFSPMGVRTVIQLEATKMEFMNDPPRYRCFEGESRTSFSDCFRKCNLKRIARECNCRYVSIYHYTIMISTYVIHCNWQY